MRRLLLLSAAFVAAKQNPIRRVVTLLQEMSEDIEAEIEKEKKQYEKFECYCKKNDGELDQKSKLAAVTIRKTRSEVASLTGQKKALGEEIIQHKADRKDAEKRLAEAIKTRTEEKTKYDAATRDVREDLDNIDKAVVALEKGMGKSLLQTGNAEHLKKILMSDRIRVEADDRELIFGFLQNKKDYSSQSNEIVGILKMMKESINEDLGGIVGEEEAAVKAFLGLKSSLEGLIKTSGASVESKEATKGEVAVRISEAKNLITVTEKQMADDQRTLMQLKEACSDKSKEFGQRQEDAAAEVKAIGEAIGILNNDDALQLFNKTDTKDLVQVSLLQSRRKALSPSDKALSILDSTSSSNNGQQQPAIAMLTYAVRQALKGKNRKMYDFSKVIKMIDEMVVILKSEANDDISARDECNDNFLTSETEKKDTERTIDGLAAQIDQLAEAIKVQEDIVAKADSDIDAAKKASAEASSQRSEDNAEFINAVDLNKQAVALIQKAKNKLNSYYNPHLVPSEAPIEMTAEEELLHGAKTVFLQMDFHQNKVSFMQDLPAGKPETWEAGGRKTETQKGSSVLALMDLLANDINKDTQALEHDEATAQRDYEMLSADLAQQVSESSQAKANAIKTKDDYAQSKLTAESTHQMKEEELTDIKKTISDLHTQCDFILGAFEERKGARENEMAGLTKAKAILAGANFEE